MENTKQDIMEQYQTEALYNFRVLRFMVLYIYFQSYFIFLNTFEFTNYIFFFLIMNFALPRLNSQYHERQYWVHHHVRTQKATSLFLTVPISIIWQRLAVIFLSDIHWNYLLNIKKYVISQSSNHTIIALPFKSRYLAMSQNQVVTIAEP